MARSTIEIVQVGPQHAAALGRFFENLEARGIGKVFHPHPLTADAARERATYRGQDIYCVLAEGDDVIGYGMLRGWDEGYDIPSLGIAIDPAAQGRGLGRLMMSFLHMAALRRGAQKLRLRVHPENKPAVDLYRSLGYQFGPQNDGQYLVGLFDLRRV
jgi:[ribosomal protein S18]-alanine N-acetyltransferase